MKKQNEGDCATPNVYSFHLLTRGIYSSFNKLLNNVKIKSMPAVAAMEIHCSDVPLREAAVGVWQNDKPSCHIFRAYGTHAEPHPSGLLAAIDRTLLRYQGTSAGPPCLTQDSSLGQLLHRASPSARQDFLRTVPRSEALLANLSFPLSLHRQQTWSQSDPLPVYSCSYLSLSFTGFPSINLWHVKPCFSIGFSVRLKRDKCTLLQMTKSRKV